MRKNKEAAPAAKPGKTKEYFLSLFHTRDEGGIATNIPSVKIFAGALSRLLEENLDRLKPKAVADLLDCAAYISGRIFEKSDPGYVRSIGCADKGKRFASFTGSSSRGVPVTAITRSITGPAMTAHIKKK